MEIKFGITRALNQIWTALMSWRRLSMLIAAGVMVFMCSCQNNVSNQFTLKERFQAELNTLHEQYGFPGATAAYILPDGTTGVVAAGMADSENNIPMTPQSRMLAASIGKTFVGATVIMLSQEKVLNLDGPIEQWLGERPWFSRLPNHNQITVRQLLNHTSGIANHVEMEGFIRAFRENRGVSKAPLTPEEMISFVLDQPPLCKPGEEWHYSDTGYLLIGLLIEKVTGHNYYEEINRRFLAPLGLICTTPSDTVELHGLATGYISPDNAFDLPSKSTLRPGVMCWNPAIEWTGGGLVSTPRDLVVWAKALYEGTAIKGDYLHTLVQSVPVSENCSETQYGISVAIHHESPFGPTYGHSGWIPGYCSSLRYYTMHGIAVAFQLNTDIGIADGTTHVFEEMEKRLADVVISSENN